MNYHPGKMRLFSLFLIVVTGMLLIACQAHDEKKYESVKIHISTAMQPPKWAIEERNLFSLYDSASCIFADKYLADNGFLKVVERWGGNDGPDDAMENFSHWPLAHALGGSENILKLYKKAWEGHLIQYTNAKVPCVEMAKEGMYYKEFITSFDWEHNGEGLSAFNFYGLAHPNDSLYKTRMLRFAGFYLNEGVDSPNYDTVHKIIRSLHNGSKGPKLTYASETDWGGAPVEGHPERLERYRTASNIVGDHPLNLLATTLAMNAYMLTGDNKYRDWILEYTGAWRDRIIKNEGNIPTNIGLDGVIGGEWDGKWYGGTFGWNFWPESNVRNYFIRGPRVGLGNAYMLTADKNFIQPLRMQMNNLFEARKMDGSTVLLPNKYGDNGWYGYIPQKRSDVLRDIYLWSMDSSDLKNLKNDPWMRYLQGEDSTYPERALQIAQKNIIRCIDGISSDTSSLETRDTDDIQKFNPINAGVLVNLTTGGNDPGIGGNILHCRARYFDPQKQRAGLPEDVAALVQKITPDGIELILVNMNPEKSCDIIIQAGAYGEHQFEGVIIDNREIEINSKTLKVELAKGAGSKLNLKMKLYQNSPSLALPW